MIDPPARLVLLGHPVGHSLSPLFQNAALRSAGIPIAYEPLDVEPARLAFVLDELVAARAGGNVTIPHKEAVAARCATRTAVAERIGAVNTFWVDERGALVGDNTDAAGFDALVASVLGAPPADARVALLGAGGAAAAALAAMERWPGCRVTVVPRSATRAARLAARFPVVSGVEPDAASAVQGASLVVNATPVGLAGEELPVPVELLRRDAVVLDLPYRRGETPWVRAARARGLRAADGQAMLIEQGALAFERWFGVAAPRDVMRAALS